MTRNAGYGTGGSPFKPPSQQPALHRLVPVSQHLSGYQGSTFRRDLLAGLTVAALALPAAMAYAELAGLSPVAGLYALLLPTVAYTLFGSSRQLIIGPEGSIAALVATALVPLAAGDPGRYASLAALLALLVGACFLVARVVRLGWVADYFSRAVLIGYLHGVAVVLVIGQLAKLLGLDIDARDPLAQLAEVVRELPELHGTTVLVGALCLASLLLLRWRLPKLPGALLVVVAAIAASAALGLVSEGVATVGEIPSGLPGLALPTAPLGDLLALVPAALGIFFVSFSDEILTARSFAGHHGQHVSADTELTAMGAASLAAGITQGFPIGASGSRTAVNDQMGARTQLSGLLGAGAIAVVLLFLTEPMQYLPKAALGAVIVAAAIGLVDRGAWQGLARTSQVEVAIAAVTMAGVVAVGVLEALLVAVALSIVDVARRSATPHDAVLGWVERLGRYANVRLHPRAQVTPRGAGLPAG
ncbi:MAG: SulP family inorganic anion transporter [Actinomycetota bacterium]|nr:SulP family inorganic anion transporter [Actinomycetota bacterium]